MRHGYGCIPHTHHHNKPKCAWTSNSQAPLPTLVKKPQEVDGAKTKTNHPNIKLASFERKKGGRYSFGKVS
jgi:hypothetical protein